MLVKKIEAAQRQLNTAIKLWIDDEDPVSIHSLAYAAHQIVHDLNMQNRGAPLLLDSPLVKKEHRGEFIRLIKFNSNFFKHADARKAKNNTEPQEIEFDPSLNESFILLTIHGLGQLHQNLTDYQVAFKFWGQINKPELFSAAWQEEIQNPDWADRSGAMRTVSKKQFFDAALQAVANIRAKV